MPLMLWLWDTHLTHRQEESKAQIGSILTNISANKPVISPLCSKTSNKTTIRFSSHLLRRNPELVFLPRIELQWIEWDSPSHKTSMKYNPRTPMIITFTSKRVVANLLATTSMKTCRILSPPKKPLLWIPRQSEIQWELTLIIITQEEWVSRSRSFTMNLQQIRGLLVISLRWAHSSYSVRHVLGNSMPRPLKDTVKSVLKSFKRRERHIMRLKLGKLQMLRVKVLRTTGSGVGEYHLNINLKCLALVNLLERLLERQLTKEPQLKSNQAKYQNGSYSRCSSDKQWVQ